MKMKALGGTSAALLLAMGAPAVAQNSDAPVDVTAAPPASTDVVGPSQLQNFNLQGTVTHPAEHPAATQSEPAATAPTESRVSSASDVAGSAAPSADSIARRPTASSSLAATASRDAPASADHITSTETVTRSLPLDVTTNPAPQPSYDGSTLPAAASIAADNGLLSWPWIAALIALIGGGAFITWSRRRYQQRLRDPARMAFAGPVPDTEVDPAPLPRTLPRPDPVPPRGQPAPRPDSVPPVSARRPSSAPASEGLIVSTRLKPELNVQFQPDRAVITEQEVLLQFDVILTNSGSAPARDVLVEAKLVPAHEGQDREIAAFFEQPQATGDRMAAIAPLSKVALKSAVRLPIDQLHSFEIEGRKLFVPLVAFNILFRSGVGEGQASASFLVGRGGDGDEKLAPFRLDLGPRIFRGLSARPHSSGLTSAS
ncbi:hypothetical protein LVY65_11875 [Sphingomonas sp. G124]|uniref:Uncharacterized protein n=1 Tax=Sphingomonas cremea TaxID=2904799 RepID=A0A9X1TY05_9SPHN|nr:hypothetical protein [Sphingomonas cremea]MCF2515755.1 hypothetical protein [Sphingomonas cremea]